MGDISRRGLLTAGVWSAPVIAVTIAAPQAAASGDTITLIWAPSPALYFETITLVVNVPADSPYVGQAATLQVFPYSGYGYVNTYVNPWQLGFPNGINFQTYVPPSSTLPGGQFVFQIQIGYAYPIAPVQYYARLVDDQFNVITESSPITISE